MFFRLKYNCFSNKAPELETLEVWIIFWINLETIENFGKFSTLFFFVISQNLCYIFLFIWTLWAIKIKDMKSSFRVEKEKFLEFFVDFFLKIFELILFETLNREKNREKIFSKWFQFPGLPKVPILPDFVGFSTEFLANSPDRFVRLDLLEKNFFWRENFRKKIEGFFLWNQLKEKKFFFRENFIFHGIFQIL